MKLRANYPRTLVFGVIFLSSFNLLAQNKIRHNFNEDGSQYANFTFLNQIWLRYTDLNPGSQVFGEDVKNKLDIGLRRTRFVIDAQVHPKVYVFTQIGINNFNFKSERKAEFFIHDAWADYTLIDEKLAIGGGLTPFSGYARYSTPSAGSIMSLDAPLFQQSTGDINDQFLRGLSVYIKGRLGKFDYHLVMTDPLSLDQTSLSRDITQVSNYSFELPEKVFQGYFSYAFKDLESNKTPYMPGTYYGAKEVFNIGGGFKYQQNAMWRLENSDTINEDILLFAVDLFYETKLNADKGNVLTFYTGFFNTTFGKDFVRNIGVMNPATGLDPTKASFNGAGDNFPMTGSGNTIYLQAGYMISSDIPIQPYVNVTYSDFVLLESPLTVYEGGLNYMVDGHNIKFTLGTQFRPIVDINTLKQTSHKGMYILQMQVKI